FYLFYSLGIQACFVGFSAKINQKTLGCALCYNGSALFLLFVAAKAKAELRFTFAFAFVLWALLF
ncbi:MAG TPA: hypothetical protein VF273_02025, partial [Pelobium sp.]